MKKILILTIIFFAAFTHAQTKQKCSDLPGFKKIGKDSMEYIKCLKSDKKFKLKTDSKVKDWITGEKKIKMPDPVKGIKNIGKALKPSALEK